MQNLNQNALTTDELNTIAVSVSKGSNGFSDLFRFFNWLQAVQDDINSIPDIYTAKNIGGVNFPNLPVEKIGLLFLTSGTYEATVIGGVDKWRRLYDGTTFDIGDPIP